MFTSAADLQVDGEDGVGAGRVFVHQCVAHCPVPPALLQDSLTLPHTVHSVHREVPHIHPTLWVLFQLCIHQPQNIQHTHKLCQPLQTPSRLIHPLCFVSDDGNMQSKHCAQSTVQ